MNEDFLMCIRGTYTVEIRVNLGFVHDLKKSKNNTENMVGHVKIW